MASGTAEVTAQLEQSIDALYELARGDPANAAAYLRQVKALRFQIIDTAWDDIVARTEALGQAGRQIEEALRLAGGAAPAAGAVSRLRNLAAALAEAAAPVVAIAGARGARRLAMGRAAEALPVGRLRVLCVHGVGDHRAGTWKQRWLRAIQAAIDFWNPNVVVEPVYCDYDDLVVEHGVSAGEYAEAVIRLGWSGLTHGIGDLFRRPRGLFDVPETIRWTAGMVAQWSADEDFRDATRQRLREHLGQDAAQPFDAVLAHSLGSLVMYDTLVHEPDILGNGAFVSFGSQIGNPFVRGVFGGALTPLRPASHWYHLFNRHDRVFTKEIRLAADNFNQVSTEFNTAGSIANHDAEGYLGHENAINGVWRTLAARAGRARGGRGAARGAARAEEAASPAAAALTAVERVFEDAQRTPDRRALLIGINDYPDPADRLEGCVNDVFKMSALLQEMNFAPEEIRVVLDSRATAAAIRERLDWLLRDVREGDHRVLCYSGHGARIPTYGPHGEPDHLDECLVPWDFDWTLERAITDDQFYEYYVDLPFGAIFVAMFDCCHSGGIERGGAAPRARGLAPPDDIRHRALKWNRQLNMWVPRDFEDFEPEHWPGKDRAEAVRSRAATQPSRLQDEVYGKTGILHRLGGAAPVRWHEEEATAEAPGFRRPYMPLIIQACQEEELAYEYRHGVQSFGAFTWTLSSALAAPRPGNQDITFEQLVNIARHLLPRLGYAQHPDLRGPTALKQAPVPWKPPPSIPPASPLPPAPPDSGVSNRPRSGKGRKGGRNKR